MYSLLLVQTRRVQYISETTATLHCKPVWIYIIRNYTDKKENKTFLIYKEIQMGSGAKSYMRKGFLIYEEMRKFFLIYEEAVSHI